jgi:hypothetical protein
VTGFFRDPDAWDVVRTDVVPRLLEGRAGALDIKIYATDVDDDALLTARQALYRTEHLKDMPHRDLVERVRAAAVGPAGGPRGGPRAARWPRLSADEPIADELDVAFTASNAQGDRAMVLLFVVLSDASGEVQGIVATARPKCAQAAAANPSFRERLMASGSTGFTRWTSKPASRVRRRSST